MSDDKYTPDTTDHDRSLIRKHGARGNDLLQPGFRFRPGELVPEDRWNRIFGGCKKVGNPQTRYRWCEECQHWLEETDLCEHLKDG